MKKLIVALALLLAASFAQAQVGGSGGVTGQNATLLYYPSNPTGACTNRTFVWQMTTNVLWICEAGVWVDSFASVGASFPLLAPTGAAQGYMFADNPTCGLDATTATLMRFICVSGGGVTRQFQINSAGGSQNISMTESTAAQSSQIRPGLSQVALFDGSFDSTVNQGVASFSIVFGGTSRVSNPSFQLSSAVASSTFLSFIDIAAPTNSITFTRNTASPTLTIGVTDGTNTLTETRFAGGLAQWSRSANDGVQATTDFLTTRGYGQPFDSAGVTGDTTITPRGNVFIVTAGLADIDTITATSSGTCYVLIFADTTNVTEAGNIRLSAAPFSSTADDTLTLCHDGTNWYETARSVN